MQKKLLAHNKKIAFDNELFETYEAGIVLLGSEVKSIRNGNFSIGDAFCYHNGDEIEIRNLKVDIYPFSNFFKHDPYRVKKLLLNKREINKLIGATTRKGLAILPIKLYLNDKNLIKLEIALAKTRKKHDKREVIKEKDWNRQKQRIFKNQEK